VSEIKHWKKNQMNKDHTETGVWAGKYAITNMIKSLKTTSRYHCFHIKIISP